MFKTMEELENIIDLGILPKDYNLEGKYTCKEISAELLKMAEARKEEILMQGKMVIKTKQSECLNESNMIINDTNCNFRTLNVD